MLLSLVMQTLFLPVRYQDGDREGAGVRRVIFVGIILRLMAMASVHICLTILVRFLLLLEQHSY